MLHLFHWFVRIEWWVTYVDNGLFGLEVMYHGKQEEGTYYLYPQIDQTTQTIKYYAFDDIAQKQRFLELLKIQWVWGKSAYQIVQLPREELRVAIETLDVGVLQRIPGIWPKTAKRVLLELKQVVSADEMKKLHVDNKVQKDVVQSLRALWYQLVAIKELLQQSPYPMEKEHLSSIMKRMIERL